MPEDFPETRDGGRGGRGAAARRLGFRFVFSYFLLYGLELVLRWVPGARGLLALYLGLWTGIVRGVGRHVLHLGQEISAVPTGSGDRTFDYVQVLCMLVLAALAALIWTLVNRQQDRRLGEGLRIYLRYALGLTLLAYGMSKVTKVEFPFPGIDRLQERIGDSSPLALYSVFMGYSTPYTFFIGASAVLAGLLLFFRRTTTLGALLSLAVLVNEWMLAFCYDVPTKLLSSHLLGIALFLLAPDARRLAFGLLLARPTRAASIAPPWTGRRTRLATLALKTLIVGYALVSTTKQNLDIARERRLALKPQQQLRKADGSKYLLVTRGIHVIDDDPMNQ